MSGSSIFKRDTFIMQRIFKVFSRRKHSRFHAKEKTFIVFQPFTPDEQKLQVIDISEGGCAFIYTGEESDLESISNVSLVCDNDHQIDRVPLSKVRDELVSGPFRKRGVEFRWLGDLDREKLKRFIEQASLCKA